MWRKETSDCSCGDLSYRILNISDRLGTETNRWIDGCMDAYVNNTKRIFSFYKERPTNKAEVCARCINTSKMKKLKKYIVDSELEETP